MLNFRNFTIFIQFTLEFLFLFIYAIFTRGRSLLKIIFPGTPKSLTDQVVLVTGGANGIGRAICQELARREKKLTIIIWDVDQKAINETTAALKSSGLQNVFALNVDVGDRSQVAAAAEKVRKEIGDVSMLFNNAGIAGHSTDGWKEDPKIFEKVFAVNMMANFWTVREFLPKMIEKGTGHIVATCSSLGFLPTSSGSAYAVSKCAVRGFMENMKEDLRHCPAKPDIKFSTVYPDMVRTNMTSGGKDDCCIQRYKFLNRGLTPEEVAQRAVHGALLGKEHIYVPSWFSGLHFLIETNVPEFTRKFLDFAGQPVFHNETQVRSI